MPFNLEEDLRRTREVLHEVQGRISASAVPLRQQADFATQCAVLAERCQSLFTTLPPPEPTPPKTEHEIVIEDVRLVEVTRLRKFFAIFTRTKSPRPDARGMIPVKVRDRRKVQLPNPLLPGTGPFEFDVDVEVNEVVRTTVSSGKRFAYQLRKVSKTYRIHIPAIPPDKPLTPVQAAYLKRRKELAQEVRDITTFVELTSTAVADLENKTNGLRENVEALNARVGQLPQPPAAAEEILRIAERMEALRQSLPGLEQELNARGEAMKELKKRAQAICPELQL